MERQINMLLVFLYMCFKAIQCKWLILWCHLVISKSKTFRNICIYLIWFSWITNTNMIVFFYLITLSWEFSTTWCCCLNDTRLTKGLYIVESFVYYLTNWEYILFINVVTYNILFIWMIFGCVNLNAHLLFNSQPFYCTCHSHIF